MKINTILLCGLLLPTSAYSLNCDNFYSKLMARSEVNSEKLYDSYLNNKITVDSLIAKLNSNEKKATDALEHCRKTNKSELRRLSIPR